MIGDRFAEQATGIEWRTVSGCNHADFALRNHSRLRYGNTEEVWMYGPQSGRQCPQLDSFYTAAFDKRDRILEVVMSVLRAVRREDAAGRHRLAVDSFDDAQFICANFNQRHFADDFLKNAPHDEEEENQKNEGSEEHRQRRCDVKVLHGMSLSIQLEAVDG